MTRICPWCGMVLEIGAGSGVTHGCCPNCLAKLMDEIKARDWHQEAAAAEPLQFPVSSFNPEVSDGRATSP